MRFTNLKKRAPVHLNFRKLPGDYSDINLRAERGRTHVKLDQQPTYFSAWLCYNSPRLDTGEFGIVTPKERDSTRWIDLYALYEKQSLKWYIVDKVCSLKFMPKQSKDLYEDGFDFHSSTSDMVPVVRCSYVGFPSQAWSILEPAHVPALCLHEFGKSMRVGAGIPTVEQIDNHFDSWKAGWIRNVKRQWGQDEIFLCYSNDWITKDMMKQHLNEVHLYAKMLDNDTFSANVNEKAEKAVETAKEHWKNDLQINEVENKILLGGQEMQYIGMEQLPYVVGIENKRFYKDPNTGYWEYKLADGTCSVGMYRQFRRVMKTDPLTEEKAKEDTLAAEEDTMLNLKMSPLHDEQPEDPVPSPAKVQPKIYGSGKVLKRKLTSIYNLKSFPAYKDVAGAYAPSGSKITSGDSVFGKMPKGSNRKATKVFVHAYQKADASEAVGGSMPDDFKL